MTKRILAAMVVMLVTASTAAQDRTSPRASDLGLKVGILTAGSLAAITDVAGVEVGHTTVIRGNDVRTRLTPSRRSK